MLVTNHGTNVIMFSKSDPMGTNQVLVLYDFDYSVHGHSVHIRKDEVLVLKCKYSEDWWQVERTIPDRYRWRRPKVFNGDCSFFVPRSYVKLLANSNYNDNDDLTGLCLFFCLFCFGISV